MVTPASVVRSSVAAPTLRVSTAEARTALRLQKQELTNLGVQLARLRSNLEQIQRIGLEVASSGTAARMASGSSLDLTSAEAAQTIGTVSNLSGISTGNFQINGVDVSVDTSSDSLNDVISRINSSGVEVTASLSPASDFLAVTSGSLTADLTVTDGTSGFFTAVNISPGTTEPTPADDSLKDSAKIGRLLEEVGKTIDDIFNPSFQVLSPTLLEAIQDEIEDTITDAFKLVLSSTKNVNALRSGLGIDIDLTKPSEGVFELDPASLSRSFKSSFTSLRSFLFDESRGFVTGLIATLDELGTTPLEELDPESGAGYLVQLRV
jgi:hypothetical protein